MEKRHLIIIFCILLLAGVFVSASIFPLIITIKNTSSSLPIRISQTFSESFFHHVWGHKVTGILRFRGNPRHTDYGTGPFAPVANITWQYPEKPMCRFSTVFGMTKEWCGTGWTGQPLVWEHSDGTTEILFGAYDGKFHFVDAETGKEKRTPLETNDIIKGSPALDPDGYPIVYTGSRDNLLRIIALDREEPTVLWSLDSRAISPVMWNDDWDGAPLILNDVLYEGGENGWIYAIQLNRTYNEQGYVVVNPEILATVPGWDQELLDTVDGQVSIESSFASYENRMYITNSAGRIMGFDRSRIEEGLFPLIFDYRIGDDIDASIVIDDEGMLYVASEYERKLPAFEHEGQITKLNPYRPDDPIVWRVFSRDLDETGKGGFWATPALYKKYLYAPNHTGSLFVIDTTEGVIIQTIDIPRHTWSSPSIIDNQLVLPTCNGHILTYTLQENGFLNLTHTFTLPSGACIESTPSIWKGSLFVGARDGYLYRID